MKRTILLITILAALLLSACSPAVDATARTPIPTLPPVVAVTATTVPEATKTAAPEPQVEKEIRLTDGLKRSVVLSAPAQKIVSMAPSNTEILFALSAGKQVIGRDDFSNYPAEAANLPSVGGNMGAYNMEAITALQPDLVLAAEINTPEQVKALEDLGIPVYYLSNPTDIEGMYANLEIVGKLTGREAEAAALVESLRTRVDAVVKKLAGIGDRPSVFYELDGSDPAKPWTVGPGTFMDLLITLAGGQNAAAGLESQWGQISQEELLVQNPDFILLGDAAYGVTAEQVAARAGWGDLQAVKSGQIVAFNDDMASRPGPRLVDGLEILAKLLHPDLFK